MEQNKYKILTFFFKYHTFLLLTFSELFWTERDSNKSFQILKVFYTIDLLFCYFQNYNLNFIICLFFFPFSFINVVLSNIDFITHYFFLYNFFKLLELYNEIYFINHNDNESIDEEDIKQQKLYEKCFRNLNPDENEFDDAQCYICLQTEKEMPGLKKIPCRHTFHKNCLEEWFSYRKMYQCPVCRYIYHPQRLFQN